MSLPTDIFGNGTFGYVLDFFKTNVAGSELVLAIIFLTILLAVLLTVGFPPKFAFSFFLIGMVSFFGIQVWYGVPGWIGGIENSIYFVIAIILFMGFIVYLIYNALHG